MPDPANPEDWRYNGQRLGDLPDDDLMAAWARTLKILGAIMVVAQRRGLLTKKAISDPGRTPG
jgi:hypothetical protein